MWLIPSQFCRSVPASVSLTRVCDRLSESLDSTLPCVVFVNGKPARRPLSWNGWKRRRYVQRLSGAATFTSSTERSGAAWIASRLVIRASRSAPPVSDVGRRIIDICGRRFVEWCRKHNPESCSSRMSTAISALDLASSCGISKPLATALRRACSARRKWARRNCGSGCSFLAWQTASSHQFTGRRQARSAEWDEPLLNGQAQKWETPEASKASNDASLMVSGDGRANANKLGWQVGQWASPTDQSKGGATSRSGERIGELLLGGQATNWPTAAVADSKGEDLPNKVGTPRLGDVAQKWGRGCPATAPAEGTCNSDGTLRHPPYFHQAEPTTPAGLNSLLAVWTRPSCPRLSPAFQWWLMGIPHPRLIFSGSEETPSSPCAPGGPSSTSGAVSWSQWEQRLDAALNSLCLIAEH